ncbi:MAG TPA: methyltransferase domain-containing protein [Jatrophihabitans sp.]|jgi:SAM-dependent methyltransferase|uniref:methyltransferase domain-containing protein n=1 Tax=Jatrophihabitans sp. TaxID=1932789 RepID=UPI002E0135DF|nr:methyltransferase domain-containing protein [Jatrophihabitans sp.]
MSDEGYLLDNRVPAAGDRFTALGELLDPVTFRHVDALGIGAGARVWEVGAGGSSVPAGLAERVGPSGHVLATDIDTSWLPGDAPYETRVHDVGTEPPPEGPFDLIHARLVLVHVPRRAEALRSMLSVLRPGGWLLLEDADPALQPRLCPDESGPAEVLANRLRDGFRTLMAARGADLAFGRTLPRLLRESGLRDVAADAYFPITSPACAVLEAATVAHIRGGLVAAGQASDAEIDEHLANVASGTLDLATAPLISAWGRAPR